MAWIQWFWTNKPYRKVLFSKLIFRLRPNPDNNSPGLHADLHLARPWAFFLLSNYLDMLQAAISGQEEAAAVLHRRAVLCGAGILCRFRCSRRCLGGRRFFLGGGIVRHRGTGGVARGAAIEVRICNTGRAREDRTRQAGGGASSRVPQSRELRIGCGGHVIGRRWRERERRGGRKRFEGRMARGNSKEGRVEEERREEWESEWGQRTVRNMYMWDVDL